MGTKATGQERWDAIAKVRKLPPFIQKWSNKQINEVIDEFNAVTDSFSQTPWPGDGEGKF